MQHNKKQKFQPKKIVVTRSRSQSGSLLKKLSDIGLDVVSLPTIQIQTSDGNIKQLHESIETLDTYDWVIFTSVNGVETFLKEVTDTTVLDQVQIAAIGSGTKEALKVKGIKTDLVPINYLAEGLVDAFPEYQKGGKILFPRGEKGRNIVPKNLRELGWQVDLIPIYRTTIPTNFDAFDNQVIQADSIIFTSTSTVENFVKMYGNKNMPNNIISIGPITSTTVYELGFQVALEANPHTIEGIVACLENYLQI